MFDYLCYKTMDSYLPNEGPPCYIRILQACPANRKVHVYSNGHQLAKGLGFSKFTPYLTVPAGVHNINIFKGGNKSELLAVKAINMEEGEISTLAAAVCDDGIEIIKVPDPHLESPGDNARIRFVCLSHDAPLVDVALHKGDTIFTTVNYKQVTEYVSLNPGKYTFKIKSSDGGKVLAALQDIELKPGWNSTIYTVGNINEKAGLKTFIPLDGNTYITKR